MIIKRVTEMQRQTAKTGIDNVNTFLILRIFINSFLIIKYKTFKLENLLQRQTKIVNPQRVLKKVIQKAIIINKTYRKD